MTDQYQPIYEVTEWVEDYKNGGLHPIHIGDYLSKGRYKIIRKLGYGAFSTVWLAKDYRHNHYVAIKVLLAKASQNSTELRLLRFLKKNSSCNSASKYIIQLIDEFNEVGPNGIHQCLVTDVSGPNLEDFMLSGNIRLKRPDYFTLELMKMISFQIISGVTYLHDLGICHGDLQPGNIVTSIPNIDGIKESDLNIALDPEWNSPPVKRLDGKDLDRSAPRYLLTSKPLMRNVDSKKHFAVKIADLGEAFFVSDPPKQIMTPTGLRAPEIIFGESLDQSIDVWSLACLLFEIVTSAPLFRILAWGLTPEEVDDEHLVHLVTILGKLPENLQSKWKRYNLCYGPDVEQTHLTNVDVYPLREYLFREKPEEMSEEEAESFLSLLRQMLQYDPSKRISAKEALRHPWLANYVSSN